MATTFDYNARNQLRRVRSVKNTDLVANFDYDEAGDAAVASTSRTTWGVDRLDSV